MASEAAAGSIIGVVDSHFVSISKFLHLTDGAKFGSQLVAVGLHVTVILKPTLILYSLDRIAVITPVDELIVASEPV